MFSPFPIFELDNEEFHRCVQGRTIDGELAEVPDEASSNWLRPGASKSHKFRRIKLRIRLKWFGGNSLVSVGGPVPALGGGGLGLTRLSGPRAWEAPSP